MTDFQKQGPQKYHMAIRLVIGISFCLYKGSSYLILANQMYTLKNVNQV